MYLQCASGLFILLKDVTINECQPVHTCTVHTVHVQCI